MGGKSVANVTLEFWGFRRANPAFLGSLTLSLLEVLWRFGGRPGKGSACPFSPLTPAIDGFVVPRGLARSPLRGEGEAEGEGEDAGSLARARTPFCALVLTAAVLSS